MKKSMIVCFALIYAHLLQAQSLTGLWKTTDDETQQAKSQVEIYQSGDKYYGRVSKLLLSPRDSKCLKCTGKHYNKPIEGMVVLEDMKQRGGSLEDGRILDPEKGKWYACKIWLKADDPNVMVVRGYLYGFYRTQYWQRVK